MIKIKLSAVSAESVTFTGASGVSYTQKLVKETNVPTSIGVAAKKDDSLLHIVLKPAELTAVDSFMTSKGYYSGDNAETSADFQLVAITYSKATEARKSVIL